MLSLKNFKVFAVALITELKPLPITCPNSAISFLLSSTVFFKSPKLLFNASKKPLETSTWNIKKASFKFYIVPNKVLAKSSIKFPNSPPVPNAFANPFIDSFALILTPSLNPAIALTPLSLKIMNQAHLVWLLIPPFLEKHLAAIPTYRVNAQ